MTDTREAENIYKKGKKLSALASGKGESCLKAKVLELSSIRTFKVLELS